MSTISKERLEWLANISGRDDIDEIDGEEARELARIALASLEAEPVGTFWKGPCGYSPSFHEDAVPLYTAPPAPLEIADLHRKAAIHDALCEKYKVESLTDFVAWQSNHIAELEAAPPAPVGHGETAVMPDYPGYAMTQRECFEAGKKAGVAEIVTTANKLPFEQWLSQQTGTIDVECGCVMTEVFFHWLRVAYEAGNSTATPDGWVACSERMPSPSTGVIVAAPWQSAPGGYAMKWATNCPGHPDADIDGWVIPGASWSPTHWMPLPAAPQEEVK
ncbi:DUF551 domain-containing protein [Enterobacter hormaechei]|uniref:DUF551 domain-containing protein n=1 Tax=Enterobacter hormaechei TaxID=158836 RepID=UPI001EF9A6CF|nr:DUF551 domain-containing protein [Enterobacter hormaechei]